MPVVIHTPAHVALRSYVLQGFGDLPEFPDLAGCWLAGYSRQLSGQQRAGVGEVQMLQLLSPERIRQSYLRPRSDQIAPVSQSQQFP
ncbi:hypothetical protein LA080_000936 [Diaporthe eres]|nr:hypothetical protein LA080_000936 [Diaporthe eres]